MCYTESASDSTANAPIVVEESQLHDYVGQPPFTSDRIYEVTPPGVVMGLAWTSMGGNSLYVEAASVETGEGKGSLRTTGPHPSLPQARLLTSCRTVLHLGGFRHAVTWHLFKYMIIIELLTRLLGLRVV